MERFCTRFFGESYGVKSATFWEACGVGDLYLSCLSGRGQRLAEAFLAARMSGEPKVSGEPNDSQQRRAQTHAAMLPIAPDDSQYHHHARRADFPTAPTS